MKIVKRILQIVLLLGVFAILGMALVSTSVKQKERLVNNLIVKNQTPDLKFLTNGEIIAIVKNVLGHREDISLQEIDLKTIEKEVRKNEYVKDCDVYLNNLQKIQINLRLYKPVARVINNNSVSYYLNERGLKLPLSNKFTARVPVLSGNINYSLDSLGNQQSANIANVLHFIDHIKKDDFAEALVTHIMVKPNGDIEFVPRTGNHTVVVGEPEGLDEKFERLKIFYREGLNKLGWDEYEKVILKYEGQIIAKKSTT